jgi:hypothetical protein
MKRFHEAWARHVHECSLKSRIGEVSQESPEQPEAPKPNGTQEEK